MNFFWWFLANALVPILLPFLVLWPWKLAKGNKQYTEEVEKSTSMGAAVKDGQFCLTAIAISAASLYETLSIRGELPNWLRVTCTIEGLLGFIALLVYTLAMFFSTEVDLSKRGKAWMRHYTWGSVSLFICFLVAAVGACNHLGADALSASHAASEETQSASDPAARESTVPAAIPSGS
jgi:hypothetical protein